MGYLNDKPGMGQIWWGSIATVPSGYLFCNGAAVNRIAFAALFAAIGTIYGPGNNTTTFNLPDARDRTPAGASVDSAGKPFTSFSGSSCGCGGCNQHNHGAGDLYTDHCHTLSIGLSGSVDGTTASGNAIISGSVTGSTDTCPTGITANCCCADTNNIGSSGPFVTSLNDPCHSHTLSGGISASDSGHSHDVSIGISGSASGSTNECCSAIFGCSQSTCTVPPYFAVPFIIKT